MQGKATVLGHPIHPMLIPFPIAFFVGALVCDIISAFNPAPLWPSMSVILIGFGIIGALLAAVFGFTDYVTIPMSANAKKTATSHLVLNLLVVAIFVAAFLVRYHHSPTTAGYALTVMGVIVLGVSGALGGHLSYHYRMGVREPEEAITRSSASRMVSR